MNKAVPPEIGNSPWPPSRGKELRIADGPEGVSEEFFSDAIPGRFAVRSIANSNVGIAGLQVDNTVGTDDLKRCIAVLATPLSQAWHQPPARQCIRRRHAKNLLVAIAPGRRDRSCAGFKPIADDREQHGS